MKNLNKAKVHIEFNPPQISINNSQSIIDEMIFDLSGISKPENNDFTDLNNEFLENTELNNRTSYQQDLKDIEIVKSFEFNTINEIDVNTKFPKKQFFSQTIAKKKSIANTKSNSYRNTVKESDQNENYFLKGPVNLVGVLQLIKDFRNNIKNSINYKKHSNLSEQHYKIINDYADDFNFSHIDDEKLNIYKLKKFFKKQMKKICFGRMLLIFFSIFSKIKYSLNKIKMNYDKNLIVINPDSKSIFYWNIINLIYILLLFVFIPLEISFHLLMPLTLLTIIDTIKKCSFLIFISDILIRLHLGYYDNIGEKVMLKTRIMIKYFKSSFVYDLLFSLFIIVSQYLNNNFTFVGLFCFFKYFQLKNILTSLEEKLSFDDMSEGIFLLLKLLIKILFIAHLIACFFHIIGDFSLDLDNNLKSWLEILDYSRLNEWEYRYIYSIYWAITTMITVGYGDITPQNNYEVLFSIFIIVLGCGTFAYSINCVGSILNAMSSKEKNFSKELRILNRFMNKNNFNDDLKSRIRKYFQFVKREEDSEELEKENYIISKLSNNLQKEIILNTNGLILKKMKFFSINFSEEFLQKLVNKIKKKRFLPEEQIIQENDIEIDKNFYFVVQGQVELYLNCVKNDKYTKLCILESGEAFNQISFVNDSSSTYSAKSVSYTTIFYINRKDFISLLKEFHKDYEKFCMIRDKITLNKNFEDLKINCKLCNIPDHFINTCPSINFAHNKWKILKLYQESFKYQEKERNKINFTRKNKFKYFSNTLSHQKKIETEAKNFLNSNTTSLFIFDSNNEIEMTDKMIESCDYQPKKEINIDDKIFERGPTNPSLQYLDLNRPVSKEEIKFENNNDCLKSHEEEIRSDIDRKTITKINENIFDFKFDSYHNFDHYFTTHNYDKVINKIKVKYKMDMSINKKRAHNQSSSPTYKDKIKILKANTHFAPLRKSFFKEEEKKPIKQSKTGTSPKLNKHLKK